MIKKLLAVVFAAVLVYSICYAGKYSYAKSLCESKGAKVSEVTWELEGFCDMGNHSVSLNFFRR